MALRLLRHRSTSANSNCLFTNSSSACLPSRFSNYQRRPWTSSDGQRRYFTATQAAAALRPFYFAVHPDLFGLYPDMYKTNEQSLKALNGYIDGLYSGRTTLPLMNAVNIQAPKPITLNFYVRERKALKKGVVEKQPTIKSVQVNLRDRDPCAAVRTILESCQLPTEHLPPPVKLPWRTGGDMASSAVRRETTVEQAADDEELIQFWASGKKRRASGGFDGLRDWLSKMAPQAENLRKQQESLETDVRRKIDEVKNETGLMDIDFNISWTLTHCRGCLQLFRRALTMSRVPVMNLNGWILKFGRHGTYVSLDRSIVLGVDDLPDDWMSLIRNLNSHQAYYGDLPRLEKRLSEYLGRARIVGPSDTPVREYKIRLTTLADRLSTYSKKIDGGQWSKLTLIIENDACGLIQMENGRISIPFTVRPQTLMEFLDENAKTAVDLMDDHVRLADELKTLRNRCVEKWDLESVEWGDLGSVTRNALKVCLERLLFMARNDQEEIVLKSLLKGHRVHIGPQESCVILPDGRISIPCDWRL